MKYVKLDCSVMVDEATVHDEFARGMEFPETYGRTLDALYDLLSTCGETELTLSQAGELWKLHRYGENLKLTVKDAEAANPLLTLVMEE